GASAALAVDGWLTVYGVAVGIAVLVGAGWNASGVLVGAGWNGMVMPGRMFVQGVAVTITTTCWTGSGSGVRVGRRIGSGVAVTTTGVAVAGRGVAVMTTG